MEKVENDYKLLPNVNNITLSDDTRKIMACLAAIGDTFNIATAYVSKEYINSDVDDIIKGFSDAFVAYNGKIEELLSHVIMQKMFDSGYTQM